MTDRELLERAAKAAGVFLTPKRLKAVLPAWEWEDDFEPRHLEGGGMSGTVLVYSYSGELSGTTREEWHPLTDDGDAFRLAVALGMRVYIYPEDAFTTVACDRPGVMLGKGAQEKHNGDPYAATRRAIVRAAASLA